MSNIVFRRICLPDQYLIITTVPCPGPVFIGPAEHEGEIWLSGTEHVIYRTFHQEMPVEPVMIKAEAVYTVIPCHIGLGLHCLGDTQVIEPKIRRQMRLIVSSEQGSCLHYIIPFGKSLAPPFIIFLKRMVLRQIYGNYPFHDIADGEPLSFFSSLEKNFHWKSSR